MGRIYYKDIIIVLAVEFYCNSKSVSKAFAVIKSLLRGDICDTVDGFTHCVVLLAADVIPMLWLRNKSTIW